MVKTKIIATLGPASSDEGVLRKMIANGLDVVRLNFSHGRTEEHEAKIRKIRSLNQKMGRAVKIMQDLEGYRIRVGRLKVPFELRARQEFYLTQEDVIGTAKEVSFDYAGSLKGIKTGALIYIDDGKIALTVTGVEKKRLKVRVSIGGVLKAQKGMNILGAELEFESVTEKDRKDIQVCIRHKLDFVAQSFVRDADDVNSLREILKPKHPGCLVFAKIENPKALENLDEIIEAADGIVVARGDLGICVPIYRVPILQKEIVKRSRLKNKPVVVATQMLESMTESRLPTRAEVSDVANAVLDGATHVMLSGETAVGKHPAETIAMMNRIVSSAEDYLLHHSLTNLAEE